MITQSISIDSTTTGTGIASGANTGARTRSAIEDDTFDDACDLGQFFLNPCWYIFVKVQKALENRKVSTSTGSTDTNSANNNGVNQDCPRTRKTKFLSRVQQVFYLSAFYPCWAVIFSKALPLIRASDHLSNVHIYVAYGLFCCCIASWIVAKWTPPGTITPETMWKYDHYPYDGVLYQRQQTCPTQNIRKLARSKYDRFSHTHVPRFDHYCGWLGNTIGEENYRFFLVFTVTHTFLFTYGTIVLFWLLWTEAATIDSTSSSDTHHHSLWNKLTVAASATHPAITTTAILCAVLSFPALQMFGFHFQLLAKGQTTNEHYKWKVIISQPWQHEEEEGTAESNPDIAATTSAYSRGSVEDVECWKKAASAPQQGQGRLPLASQVNSSMSSINQQQQFYNLGFIHNIQEALFPRSLGKGGKKES